MRQELKTMTYVLLFLLLSLTACKKKDQQKYNILVLHSYSKDMAAYATYDKVFSQSIQSKGIDADIRNVYETGYESIGVSYRSFIRDLSELKGDNWAPDIICIEEDRTLDYFLDGLYDSLIINNTGKTIPVVAAGQHCPDWDRLGNRKEISVLLDEIDYEKNIRLASDISGSNQVLIQLSHSRYDLRLRNKLSDALRQGPFIDNTDYGDRLASGDSILVTAISMSSPVKNKSNGENSFLSLEEIYQQADGMPMLTLSKDLLDDELVNSSRKKNFTAIRDAFLQSNSDRLCGYFASYGTVASDQADYVYQIIKGKFPDELAVMHHHQEYYMDWKSMRLFNMSPLKWKKQFSIIGAPYIFLHPFFFTLLIIIAFGTFAFISLAIVKKKDEDNSREMDEQLTRLHTELEMFSLGLLGTNYKFLDTLEDIVRLETVIHPDDLDILYDLINSIKEKEWTTDTCVRLSNDKGKNYRWWQIRTYNDEETDTFSSGIAIDIDDSIRHTEEMFALEKVAREVTKKESFMRNLSHEIRTPLNTIVGFSEYISENFNDISEEEKEEFGVEINKNTKILEQMLEVVLQYSRFESGRVAFNSKDTNIGQLVEKTFVEWGMENQKNGVEFIIKPGHANIYAFVDPERTMEVLRQYLRNALKFTDSGHIALGWKYNDDEKTVDLFVEDTGRGIEKKKLKFVFDIFWKDDPFTQGLGLGLTLVKLFTEKMDGKVSMESTYGAGSKFIATFPCQIKQ